MFAPHLLDSSHGLLPGAAAHSSMLEQQEQLKRQVLDMKMLERQVLDMSPEAKKARVQSSMRILKDEPVPEGYIRFR